VPPRIAVIVHGDPTAPRTWSGSPAGIIGGLRAYGVEAVPIDATPPGARRARSVLRRRWTWDSTNPLVAGGSGAWADALVRRHRVDGVVQIGSGFRLRTARPLVTFEDETVAQALRQEPSDLELLKPREVKRWLARQGRIYRGARGCCVGSAWTGDSVRDDYGIDPAKIHVVGFGRNLVTEALERDWSVPRFLFLGVWWELKRGDAVLAAFAKVRERHPEATLDIAGKHPPLDAPGVRGHGLLSLASPEDRARMIELLGQATCMVVPSRREAFGIAYADAGAAGVPCIGTSVGGAPETIGPGGLVVDPGDEAGLEEAMLRLCDPDFARELGERARAHAAQFTWEAVAERILRALEPPGIDLGSLAPYVEPQWAARVGEPAAGP
jgi:glycosyltransferase involved in cell wall biosynthesis